jgi:hypothetical protein
VKGGLPTPVAGGQNGKYSTNLERNARRIFVSLSEECLPPWYKQEYTSQRRKAK